MHTRIVAALVVSVTLTAAPLCPILAQPSAGYALVFDEEFDGPLSVSNWGERPARWMAHTPYAGDFGDAYFTGYDERSTRSPFQAENGRLVISAYRDRNANNHWRSGLLASVDTHGKGFSQALGYFEARMKLPAGPGVWPAFWLAGLGCFKTPKTRVAEIDILEEYGVDPRIAHQTVHVWNTDVGEYSGTGHSSRCEGMTTGFHTYAALIKPDYIYFYFDGVEQWKTPTPPEAKEPLYVMVDLALGGGWPIDHTPDPSHLYVSYIRVYAPPGSGASSATSQNSPSESDRKR